MTGMATSLKRLDKLPVTDQATASLREYILSGALVPGARLTEIALAEQLGIGRATVRMSLNQLAFEGIVVKIPYTGWQVAELSARAIWEIWTLRGSLESLAASVTAARLDDIVARKITEARDKLFEACRRGAMDEINLCDFGLHQTIVELSGHDRLREQYRLVEHQVRFYIATSNTQVAVDGDDVIEQHRPLINALLAGDPEASAREAWLHNVNEGRRLSEWLGDDDAQFPAWTPHRLPGSELPSR
jgi:DNA-binding GntR family transcriptional regulator